MDDRNQANDEGIGRRALLTATAALGAMQGSEALGGTTLLEQLRSVTGFSHVLSGTTETAGQGTELQSLINEWAKTPAGAELRLPSGRVFEVNEPLFIPPRPDARLIFNGAGSKIVASHDGPLFDNRNEYSFFRDLWLNGPGKSNTRSIGISGSLYGGGIDNVRIDHFHTGLKIKSVTGAVRRLHCGGAAQCLWIEDFSNVLSVDDSYFTSSDEGIYVPNTSGSKAGYVAQLTLRSCAFEVMGRSVFAPTTINRFSAFNCWTERETIGSFVLVDTPAYIFNTNFVTHLPSITFSRQFPETSKQYQMIDCYHGSTAIYAGSAAVDLQRLRSTFGPDSPPIWIAGEHLVEGRQKVARLGFGDNAVLVSASNLMALADALTDLGRTDRAFGTAFLSKGVNIAGDRILGPQQPAIADPVRGSELATLKAMLAVLREHGLIGKA